MQFSIRVPFLELANVLQTSCYKAELLEFFMIHIYTVYVCSGFEYFYKAEFSFSETFALLEKNLPKRQVFFDIF